jgi:signal peptide peptidase SppA
MGPRGPIKTTTTMKQLPRISSALYGMPWAIVAETHKELGEIYQSYIKGTYTPATPAALEQRGTAGYGITYEANHSEGIAIFHLTGVITKRAPEMMCGPPIIDLARLDTLLEDIANDDAITTVILNLDSPGGTTLGLEETAGRIRELAAGGKRMIAYTDLQMCSAAYWLAAACDEIYAAPTAIIGSIGVYCAGLDSSRAFEMDGLELVLAKSGNLKAMGHPGKVWEQNERDHLQNMVDRAGVEFRSWVSTRRPGATEEAMQGQWFFAKEADPALTDGLYRDLTALLAEILAA